MGDGLEASRLGLADTDGEDEAEARGDKDPVEEGEGEDDLVAESEEVAEKLRDSDEEEEEDRDRDRDRDTDTLGLFVEEGDMEGVPVLVRLSLGEREGELLKEDVGAEREFTRTQSRRGRPLTPCRANIILSFTSPVQDKGREEERLYTPESPVEGKSSPLPTFVPLRDTCITLSPCDA